MNNPGRPSQAYRPDAVVPCGLCQDSIRYDSLKRHFKRKHESQPAWVYKEALQVNVEWRA